MGTDQKILNQLRKNSRLSITEISKKIAIPAATAYGRFHRLKPKYVKRFVPILDFPKLGYNMRTAFFLNANSTKGIDTDPVNSMTTLQGKHNIMLECVFRNNEEAVRYAEGLKRYKPRTYHLVEEVCTEEFILE